MAKYRIRITKCYLVEVVDKDGNVQYYKDVDGMETVADDYCFGTKADAEQTGKRLVKWVEESEEE